MNLLMISLHADPTAPAGIGEGGGTHSYIRELLTFLSDKDMNILLITRKSHPYLQEQEFISSHCMIRRIILNGENLIDKKLFYGLHKQTMEIIQEVLEDYCFSPDLIHSIYWNSGQVAIDLSKLIGIPFVHTVISNGLRRNMTGYTEAIPERFSVEKTIFENAAYIFCITTSEKEDLINLYGISEKKLVIPGRPISKAFKYPAHDNFGIPYMHKIDKDDITSNSKTKLNCTLLKNTSAENKWWMKKAFLYCGRIAANKGIDIIIKAWLMLKESFREDCPQLWIVGGTLEEINNFRNDLDICNKISYYEKTNELIWWGYLDQRGISTLFLKSHALIMHSSYEPGGRVIIEALSAGLPVISTPYGFGADYVHDWFNGFQVPYGDYIRLCDVMSLFIKQPYLSNHLGLNAKKYMGEVLEAWDFSKLHEKVYTAAFLNTKDEFRDLSKDISTMNFFANYINIYPFFNDIISRDDILSLLTKYFGKISSLKEQHPKKDSSIWTFTYKNESYELQQPYTKILENSYYKVYNTQHVCTRQSIYEHEKFAATLQGMNPIIYSIDEYFIFIKKRLRPLTHDEIKSTSYQINKLFHLFENNVYCCNNKILEDNNMYLESATKELYNSLYSKQNHFPKEFITLCTTYLPLIFSIAKENKPIYGFCLRDCSINNIGVDENSNYFFQSGASICWGDTSRNHAQFLYYCLLELNERIINLNDIIDLYIPLQQKPICFGWLFEICLENMMYGIITMRTYVYKSAKNLLIELITEYKKL